MNIGDPVRFLNEPGTGIIRKWISPTLLEVENEDGFILTLSKNQVVSIHPLEMEIKNPGLEELELFQKDYHRKPVPKPKEEKEIEREFDLHIEELGVPYRKLNNFEILQIQLNFFENKLGYCIQHGISPIVFIHGVGNGVLRQEIHKRLKKNPYIHHFANKGLDRLKFGATEVYLKP